jgi:serine/threonine protein kinase
MSDEENIFSVGGSKFTLSTYTDLKAIGKGSYGVVVSAFDPTSGCRVAIKKITPMAKHTLDAKHILREVRIMRYLGKHENIVTLENLHVRECDDELYIIMELMDTDLHRVLQSKQVLTEAHVRHFTIQILCGLKHLHDNRIIHRDLKPGNILVTRDCRLRITDFGLAREMATGPNPDDEIAEPMTEHVVTRWYRPPELMLCPDGLYSYAIDMWSVGCIIAEMIGRKPIFPGKNFVDQLTLIFDVIGTPLKEQVSHIKNSQAKKFLESQVGKCSVSYAAKYPLASEDCLHMLEHLLVFAPSERYTVDQALKFKFLKEAEKENSLSMQFPVCDQRCQFEFERGGLSKFQLKDLIIQEVLSFQEGKKCAHDDQEFTKLKSAGRYVPTNPYSDESLGGSNVPKKCVSGDHLNSISNKRRGSSDQEKNATPQHVGKAQNGAGISTAKLRPSSANMVASSKTGGGMGVKQVKRPSSANVTPSSKVAIKRMPSNSVNCEADKALAAARAWLSAAAAAADTEVDGHRAPPHSGLPLKPSSRSRAQKLDSNSEVSKRAMGVLRSPLRQDRFKNSPKRYGVMQQCGNRADMPPPFPKAVFSDGKPPKRDATVGAAVHRRPITEANAPKLSAMSKHRSVENEMHVSKAVGTRGY